MPEMDAFELAERIISRLPGVRILYTSGYTDATAEGPFIQKPFTPGAARRQGRRRPGRVGPSDAVVSRTAVTRVLIFTATVGEGHDLPARTLADQLREESPDSEIVTEDGLRAMGRGFVLVNEKAARCRVLPARAAVALGRDVLAVRRLRARRAG